MHARSEARPPDAEIVVIGGGIGGCSAAYHLAALGMTDVLLLDRANLSSGTTWHSTGNMETYRDDPLIFSMVRYAVESLPQLEIETGQSIGWRNVGRVMYTDREERLDLFKTLPELGRVRGISIDLLSPDEVARRLAIIDPTGLLGGIWVPSDGRVNPTDAVMAYAKAARARGVRIREHVPVSEVVVRDGIVRGVATPHGTIACNTVLVAAGLWSADIVRSCGLALPLYALEHQYLITKPISNLDRNMPLFLSYDDQLYGREEVGGLVVGSLDDHVVPIASSEVPQNFANALLSERWAQFEPYMWTAMRRFPVLRTAGIKMLQVVDLTNALTLLEIQGPGVPSALSGLFGPQVACDPIHDSTLVISPADQANYLWTCLVNAGAIAAARAGGHYAQEALRIARGIPRLGQDATPFTEVAAALAAFTSPSGLPGFGSHEAVAADDQVVGELTSRAWVPGWPATLSLALVRIDFAASSALELVADGKRWPLTLRSTHWQTMLEHYGAVRSPMGV